MRSACRRFFGFLGVLTAITFQLVIGASAHGESVVIVQTPDPVPEGSGVFRGFNVPSINGHAEVAFRAETGFIIFPRWSLYKGSAEGLTTVVRSGDPAPNGDGVFSTMSDRPAFNDAGEVVFMGFLDEVASGAVFESAIYYEGGGGLEQVARSGRPSSDGLGDFSGFSGYTAINSTGQVAFRAQAMGGNNRVYVGTVGQLALIARVTEVLPDSSGYFHDVGIPRINSTGDVVFLGYHGPNRIRSIDNSLERNNTYFTRDGLLQQFMDPGQASPDGNGVFDESHLGVMNDVGHVFSEVILLETDNGVNDDRVLYINDGNGLISIAREGQATPEGDGVFGDFFNLFLDNRGRATFRSEITGPVGGVGFYRVEDGVTTTLVRSGQPAPDGDGAFGVLSNKPAFNRAGHVLFFASLNGTAAGAADAWGLFITDGIEIVEIVRKGDTMLGSTISGFQYREGATIGGGATGLNDRGQAAYLTYLENDQQALSVYTPDLRWRGTSADGLWDSPENWTLSIDPAGVHRVTIDPATDLMVTGPAEDTSVKSLTLGGGGGVAQLDLLPGVALTVIEDLLIDGDGVLGLTVGSETGQLIIGGDAVLGGTLDLSITGSYSPDLGDTFQFLTTSSRVGEFDNVLGTDLGNGLIFDLLYGSYSVGLEVIRAPIPGDLDGDGFVGLYDLLIVLGSWNQSVPPGDTRADPSGDGIVHIQDLNEVLGNWNAGTPLPAKAVALVPEPGAVFVLGAGGLMLLRCKRPAC
jgi:hypothetical protein